MNQVTVVKAASVALALLGFALLVAGLALWSVPVAMVVAGVLLMAYAVLLDRVHAVLKRTQSAKG